MKNKNSIKIRYVVYDYSTNCDIYTIEINKELLREWVNAPGVKVVIPIALSRKDSHVKPN